MSKVQLVLYNAEVRSRSAATPRMGHQDVSSHRQSPQELFCPVETQKRQERWPTCTLCLGVCLMYAYATCTFIFISPIDKTKLHDIQKISLDVADMLENTLSVNETVLQASVKRLNPKPLFAVSLRKRTQTCDPCKPRIHSRIQIHTSRPTRN